MKSFLRLWKQPGAEVDAAMDRWRRLLGAAAHAEFYGRWRGVLAQAAAASNESAVIARLTQLPEIELSYFFEHFREFRTDASESSTEQPGASVWSASARLAGVAPWFRIGSPVRVFTRFDVEELRAFKPDVLAAPAEVVESMIADGGVDREWNLFAVVALVGVGTPVVSEDLRDRVWKALGTPLYVQFRGFHGELLARECERHEGMHIASEGGLFEARDSGELLVTSFGNLRYPALRLACRLEASFENAACGCGNRESRLMGLRIAKNRPQMSLQALAAAVGTSAPREMDHPARMLS